ncbi:MAG: phage tail protein [Pseudomonadota bacterium]
MIKLQALRTHLLERIPGLKRDPERLLTFIENGRLEFHRGAHLSHQYQVPVRIVLTDHSGELDAVMLPLLQWLSRYQPDLDPIDAVRFHAELLSNNAWDLAIDVTLTERVVAIVDCDAGRIDVEHRMPEFELDPCPATHWKIFLRDLAPDNDWQLIAEWGEEQTNQ